MSPRQKTLSRLQGWLNDDGTYFLRPWDIIKSYSPDMLRPDLMAGLSVAVVLLPQAIAYAMIAELPPQVGLYTAVVGAIIGALWGSSKFLQTGPTNASSLLVLATLLTVAQPGTPEFLAAAGFLAVITGVMKLVMGLARMGALVNFVSDSVVVGFTAGAGVLISVNQLRHLFRLDLVSRPVFRDTVVDLSGAMGTIHPESAALGVGTIVIIFVLKHWRPRWPRALVGMVFAAAITAVFGLDQRGVLVLGELPRSLPPFASLPLLDFQLMGRLSAGALAITAIGLVEAVSISRSIAQRSGQRLNSNQEFVGQGLSNIVCGLFSGYAGSGSLTRSTLNYESGAKSPMAAVFSGLWVLLAILLLAPLAVYLPRTALAAVLLAIASGMVDWAEIKRIFRSSRGDTAILFATLIATLILPLEFAVLAGVMVSFARFLMRTSMPTVGELSPDETYSHLVPLRGKRPSCPQLGVIEIEGSLYFGAVNHVEQEMIRIRNRHPGQVFLLLRMKRVDHCDVSGIHMLEALVRRYRERGGDVYLTGVRRGVLHMMSVSGFLKFLGHENVLRKEDPLGHLFYNVLHPGICIYECDKRVFAECQALPKHDESVDAEHIKTISQETVTRIPPSKVIQRMKDNPESLVLIDVGEKREYARWHIAGSFNIPMPQLTVCSDDIPRDRTVILISRIGRRSTLAAHILHDQGFTDVVSLSGGMLGWEAAGHPLAVE